MLNLSDKELDRLSREAADRHDPGDLVGPQSWERLELRLDKELGRIGPNPLQGIRRFPLYYAPVIILLVGVSYYFIRQGKGNTAKTEPSGSPPMTVVKPLSPVQNSTDQSTKTSENSENSTPHNSSSTVAAPNTSVYPGAGTGPDHQATTKEELTRSAGSATALGSAPPSGSGLSSGSTPAPGAAASSGSAPSGLTASGSTSSPGSALSPSSGSASSPGSAPSGTMPVGETGTEIAGRTGAAPTTTSTRTGSAPTSRTESVPTRGYGLASTQGLAGSKNNGSTTRLKGKSHQAGLASAGSNSGITGSRGSKSAGSKNSPQSTGADRRPTETGLDGSTADAGLTGSAGNRGSQSTGYTQGSAGSSGSKTPPREPAFSIIQDAHSLARQRGVDDSALRAAAASGVAGPIRLDKKNPGLRISRPLQFGFSFSPDFASVHSLAGDRPGSSFGLTLDYQFSDRLYLSTGLLATRKNYASSPQDYHVPDNYYIRNNIHDVSLIKGSFYMLEIPLNLRYDFLLTGNTVFFLSGGASSYLMTSEHSQYYYNLFGRQTCQDFKGENARSRNYLFSAINLSMGVETGLSNSLSLLIAPYVKVPTAGMGFGQVQITSVGLNFALKYAPVLSRKRRH